MTERTTEYLSWGFCLLWGLLIFIDYWYYHPSYYLSLIYYQYTALTIVLSTVFAGIGYLLLSDNKSKKTLFFANGLGVFCLFLIVSAIIIVMHFYSLGSTVPLSFIEVATYIGKIIVVSACTYLTFAVCYVLGATILDTCLNCSFKGLEDTMIKIAVGIIVLSILLFLLGVFNLLLSPVIWGLFIFILAAFWRKTIYFLKHSLIKRFDYHKELNWVGLSSFFLTLVFIVLIYLQNIRPVPFGFDALALYLNLPNLLYEQQGLVAGFSPYYWSLFITIGYLLVDQIEVVISLSVAGGILSAFALYALGRRWVSVNYALLTVLLFYSLPLVNFQSFRDVKIDLGLLFILLAVVLILVNYLDRLYPTIVEAPIIASKNKKHRQVVKEMNQLNLEVATSKKMPPTFMKEEYQYILLMGLLSGGALGIKLTGLILIFSIVAVLFYLKAGPIGFLTSCLLTFFVILIGGLDVASGLRAYHFETERLQWIILLISVLGIGYIGITRPKSSMQLIKICLVYLFFTSLIYLPWPIKNYSETKVLSFQTFIEGRGHHPTPIK